MPASLRDMCLVSRCTLMTTASRLLKQGGAAKMAQTASVVCPRITLCDHSTERRMTSGCLADCSNRLRNTICIATQNDARGSLAIQDDKQETHTGPKTCHLESPWEPHASCLLHPKNCIFPDICTSPGLCGVCLSACLTSLTGSANVWVDRTAESARQA